MLDLACLKRQLNQLVEQQRQWSEKQRRQLEAALGSLHEFSASWQDLRDKIARSKTSWRIAGLNETPDQQNPLPARPAALSVLASDGSQIFPDRHQLAPYYLINIGLVAISYGTGQRPVLHNEPCLCSGENPWGLEGGTGREDIGIYRNLLELQGLGGLADQQASGDVPLICLSDGSLIWWSLESKDKSQELRRQQFLEQALAQLDKLRQMRIPLAGYISRPGGAEVVNALRVGLCPQQEADCAKCPCPGEALPCAVVEMVQDRTLFACLLQPGERSAIFQSNSPILTRYGQHRIHFYYLHVGYEVVRVEVPQWVAADSEYLNLTHSTLYDQAQKGLGYPVVLSEAHQQAVVKTAERKLFYQLLESEFVRHDLRVNTSRKSHTKVRVPT